MNITLQRIQSRQHLHDGPVATEKKMENRRFGAGVRFMKGFGLFLLALAFLAVANGTILSYTSW
jgi:hypothetical protein